MVLPMLTITSKICQQEAKYTAHAVTCSRQSNDPVCKLYFVGSRKEVMFFVDHTALVMALVKQINCCS